MHDEDKQRDAYSKSLQNAESDLVALHIPGGGRPPPRGREADTLDNIAASKYEHQSTWAAEGRMLIKSVH